MKDAVIHYKKSMGVKRELRATRKFIKPVFLLNLKHFWGDHTVNNGSRERPSKFLQMVVISICIEFFRVDKNRYFQYKIEISTY